MEPWRGEHLLHGAGIGTVMRGLAAAPAGTETRSAGGGRGGGGGGGLCGAGGSSGRVEWKG